jgi:RNA polymerase sigma-70 factor (ECF subfamily)
MPEALNNAELGGLLDAARQGDRAALGRLLSHYMQPIYRFGMKMCRDPEDAQEVLQDTLLAAARTVGDFRGDASVSTWLYTIARSFCIKRRRRGKHAPKQWLSLDHEAGAAAAATASVRAPDAAAADSELGRALAAAISSLEPSYREVLVLRDVEGLTAPEVAKVLGLELEAVKSRLHRARLKVREKLAHVVETEKPLTPTNGCRNVVELFSRHLEGDIDASTCAAMEKHLASCPRCQRECEALKSMLATCRSAGPEVPRAVQDEVRAALNRFLAFPRG